jgi:hypothetical protein
MSDEKAVLEPVIAAHGSVRQASIEAFVDASTRRPQHYCLRHFILSAGADWPEGAMLANGGGDRTVRGEP